MHYKIAGTHALQHRIVGTIFTLNINYSRLSLTQLCITQYYRLSQLDCIKLVSSLDMILHNKRITKALIRLRICSGWSAPLLFANHQRQVFLRRGPYVFNLFLASSKFCHLLITFANSLDPDQAQPKFRSNLDPICLTL